MIAVFSLIMKKIGITGFFAGVAGIAVFVGLAMFWHANQVRHAKELWIAESNGRVAQAYIQRIEKIQKEKEELNERLKTVEELHNARVPEITERIREVRVEVEVPTACTDLGSDFLQQYNAQIRAARNP